MRLFASVRVNVDSRMCKAIRLLLSACLLRNPFFLILMLQKCLFMAQLCFARGAIVPFKEQLYRRGSNIRQPLRY